MTIIITVAIIPLVLFHLACTAAAACCRLLKLHLGGMLAFSGWLFSRGRGCIYNEFITYWPHGRHVYLLWLQCTSRFFATVHCMASVVSSPRPFGRGALIISNR